MDPQLALDLGQEALRTVLLLSAPVLVTTLLVGLVVGLLQAATQLTDATLAAVPKLLAAGAVLALAGAWLLQALLAYTTQLWARLPALAR